MRRLLATRSPLLLKRLTSPAVGPGPTVLNLTVAIETGSYGPGFDLAARLNNSAIQQTFTAEEEDSGKVGGQKTHWELEDVFGEAKPSWIDWDYAQAE